MSIATSDAQKEQLEPYYEVLVALNEAVEKAWSENLETGWEEALVSLKNKWIALFPRLGTKTHILMDHLIPYLKSTNRGMSLDSEQGSICDWQYFVL